MLLFYNKRLVERTVVVKNITKMKKYCLVCCVGVLASFLGLQIANAAPLSTSTNLTIVHLTSAKPNDISTYAGHWPTTPDASYPTGSELYISHVGFTSGHVGWNTVPGKTPYGTWSNGINSILTAVWSKDGGRTFQLLSWDYLGPYTHGKHVAGMPDCFMGTMISTLCDQKAGECNGRARSNLFFATYTDGAACWGN